MCSGITSSGSHFSPSLLISLTICVRVACLSATPTNQRYGSWYRMMACASQSVSMLMRYLLLLNKLLVLLGLVIAASSSSWIGNEQEPKLKGLSRNGVVVEGEAEHEEPGTRVTIRDP